MASKEPVINVRDIKAAVGLLDPADLTQWAAPGIPALSAMEKIVPGLTAEDLHRAGFALPPPPEGPGKTFATASDPKNLPEVPDVLPSPDAASADLALAITRKAQAEVADIQAAMDEQINLRSQVTARIDGLIVEKDKRLKIIEQYSPKFAFSAAVRAIQEQTGKQLMKQHEKQTELAQRFHINTVTAPSILDQAMRNRRRSPEQTSNLAAFIHQNSARQAAERG
jgi:hypothetical protein